jgi:hypothetical protein
MVYASGAGAHVVEVGVYGARLECRKWEGRALES